MDTGIYYLYEYKKNHRLRNAGFLKLTKQYQSCFLQFNARNIPVTKQDTAMLAVFYRDDSDANAAQLTQNSPPDCLIACMAAEISCENRMISAKITLQESQLPAQRTLNRIDGFFLTLPHGEILVAAASDIEFDARKISYLQPEPEPEASQDTASEPESQPEAPQDTAPEPQPEASHDTAPEPQPQPEAPQDTAPEPEVAPVGQTCAEAAQTEAAAPKDTARKIQRSDLSILPRKHWNIANNSFLLHGYYNYNHLLLVEEEGHYWLGVPGIYDSREARAAELFGFAQFTDSYNERLTLTKDECSDYGRFGYWCRYLR